jgi:hypothetical protein
MPLQATSGAASYDAFGGGTVAKVNYIEDFFQSYLRTGTGASATVTTGLDGSTKETLVWTKSRSASTNHKLTDNVRGATKALSSNTTSAEATDSQGLTAFSATGYTIGTNTDYNNSGATYVDWQWVSQPKFFDVVTYTGASGNAVQNISHNLGSVPACIIIKCTDQAGYNWIVYHRSLGATKYTYLNTTAAAGTSSIFWNNTEPTSTQFTVGTSGAVNGDAQQYVAYLFAHDAGGFGLTGTDNVISCGSGVGGTAVNLGYEPQWVMIKKTDLTSAWYMVDNMRGWTAPTGTDQLLAANSSAAEFSSTNYANPTATGFIVNAHSDNFIYIAIRRGPMKVPVSGSSVFAPVLRTGTGSVTSLTSLSFPPDMLMARKPSPANTWNFVIDRLRGYSPSLTTQVTDAEQADTLLTAFGVRGVTYDGSSSGINQSGQSYINYFMGRAPSFFDEVCYTGNGSTQTITHNLGVTPELIIAKNRGQAGNNWPVLFNFSSTNMNYGFLNLTNSCPNDTYANVGVFSAAPTSTSMYLVNSSSMNASGYGIVAYLFASCPGVSKVFSYTGNGSSQTINCGFTGGARFVMVKRTDSSGNWLVVDTARGLVSAGDPTLYLNSTAAEVTGVDWIDPDNSGFIVNQEGTMNANVSSATYIGLAIA